MKAPNTQADLDRLRLEFAEQIRFFRRKLNLPTEHWRSIERAAHDRAFVVAGAMKADLLADLRKAVDEAVRGESLDAFRSNFLSIVAKHGWTGWTGEDSPAGIAWRTRVIYQTNLATSYAAGRWAQLHDPQLLARRPYWRYVHSDAHKPRVQHKAWGDMGLTLRHDHPFWQTHYPPNGWGCGCYVTAVRAPQGADADQPPPGWDAVDTRTGAPPGIDKGWDYAPGARADEDLRRFVQDKLITYPPAIEKALSAELNRHLNATERVESFVRRVRQSLSKDEDLWLGFISDAQASELEKLIGKEAKGYLVLLPAHNVRHTDHEHQFDGGDQRPARPEDYRQILGVLNEADSLALGATVGKNEGKRIVVRKKIGQEVFRAVFEVNAGRRNRSIKLISLAIKTQKPHAPQPLRPRRNRREPPGADAAQGDAF